MKYRKKPVVIEAVQFNNSADIHEFCGEKVREPVGKEYMEIETLEGTMRASPGDFVIKGVNGEFYPCKPDIFEKTYQPVEGNEIWDITARLRARALMVRETSKDEDAIHLANDTLFLIAAFESAEAELAEYKRKAVEHAVGLPESQVRGDGKARERCNPR